MIDEIFYFLLKIQKFLDKVKTAGYFNTINLINSY